MPVRNNGPGGYSRASTTRKSKTQPEYPQWAESKMRAIIAMQNDIERMEMENARSEDS